jgi:hypothetical protein
VASKALLAQNAPAKAANVLIEINTMAVRTATWRAFVLTSPVTQQLIDVTHVLSLFFNLPG